MVSGEPAVEFRHFVQLIAIGLQARIPMHMTGFPGVGKTEFTKSLEAGFGRVGIKCKVMVLVGSIREPQDFGGFPVSTPDGVRLMPMAWARDAQRLADGEPVVARRVPDGSRDVVRFDGERLSGAGQHARAASRLSGPIPSRPTGDDCRVCEGRRS